jgi:hypothetical protein
MPDPEEDPAGSSAQKSAFRPVDSGQFQIGTLNCYNHAIFAVRQWPRRTFPGIITALTGMGFQEYAITMNVYPKRVDKVIEKEEAHIQRLQIDALSERKQSLVTDLVAKQEKVNELQQGKVIPLTTLYVVRIWHRDPDILAARAASLKNAFISMGGATIHHATIPESARQLFFQTWPGWTFSAKGQLANAVKYNT